MCGPHPVASDRQAGKAIAVDQPQLDVGSTAWLLTSAALVLLMTPGVAFFYGGMIRQSNVLSMIMQSLMTIGTVSVLWVLVGFSLAFGAGNGFVGGLDLAGLRDLAQTVPGMHIDGVPILAFAVFQMMFAVVTPVLITGAGAERWRFSAYITFVALWSMLVYAPIAHWFFSPLGWGSRLGALDFAGGTVVHVNAGVAALVVAAVLGRRTGWPAVQHRAHNLPLMLLGTIMMWFGWFGFNGGSALAPNGIAALAVTNTQVSAAAGLMAWACAEQIRVRKPTTLGAASGAIAGLVAITPAAGYVTPLSAVAIGAAAGVICHFAVSLKALLGLDDALDVAAVHLGGGAVGSLAVGLLATTSVNPAASNGLFYGGGYRLLGVQALTLGAAVVYSAVVTLLIVVLADRMFGNRVSPRGEVIGLDLFQHGESAYAIQAPSETAATWVPNETAATRVPNHG